MPNDQEQKKEGKTGILQARQDEAAAKAELIQEITAALDGLSTEELKQVLAALILLFEWQKK